MINRNHISKNGSLNTHILLIADVPNWIFDRHCHVLKRYLSNDFSFDIIYKNIAFNEDDFDLIYPLEWNLVRPEQIHNPAKYVTGIRSHLFWTDLDFTNFLHFLNTKFQKIHVVSKRLLNIFKPYLSNIEYVTHGVDTEFFKPSINADQSGKQLRLGWVGNRRSTAKGFYEFVEPLGKLRGVELIFYGFDSNNISMDKIRDFYNSLDAYICTSSTEGNSNPLLEAASMERAIITTDVGTVSEYLKNSESALIVERKLQSFILAVEQLRDNPITRVEMGKAARQAVLNGWDWKIKAEDYKQFFKESIRFLHKYH